jgi:hypothetical protein
VLKVDESTIKIPILSPRTGIITFGRTRNIYDLDTGTFFSYLLDEFPRGNLVLWPFMG